MSHACEICGKRFSTRGNLERHIKNIHGDNHTSRPVIPIIDEAPVMQHPFTCIVAGCTQSGKTVWVKTLLENARTTIRPPPERIIWCYGQWQPMYFEMMKSIPHFEINEGIPEDIDKDDFLDTSKRNVIVLDDLMAQSGKDKRIADLFTKGSHHRNLSVIYIVQNVFHQAKETRNISLNTHYIVLFKSPRDKQQISTLARQISPGRVQEFMKKYEEATRRPHGYLMLDLKPNTNDNQRLKTNVLPGETNAVLKKQEVRGENNDVLEEKLDQYIQKQSYQQPPILNAMYNSDQKMQGIIQSPQLTPHEKNILYSNEFLRFQAFQNQMRNEFQPVEVQKTLANENLHVDPQTPGKPEPSGTYFLTPPNTIKQPKLESNFFHEWESLGDWNKRDVPLMSPEEKQDYEQHMVMTRSKYKAMRKEDVEKLSPEEKKEYHDTFNMKTSYKSPMTYHLRSRPY